MFKVSCQTINNLEIKILDGLRDNEKITNTKA